MLLLGSPLIGIGAGVAVETSEASSTKKRGSISAIRYLMCMRFILQATALILGAVPRNDQGGDIAYISRGSETLGSLRPTNYGRS